MTTFRGTESTSSMSSPTTDFETAAPATGADAPYAVRHVGWPQPERVVLPVGADPDAGVVVTQPVAAA